MTTNFINQFQFLLLFVWAKSSQKAHHERENSIFLLAQAHPSSLKNGIFTPFVDSTRGSVFTNLISIIYKLIYPDSYLKTLYC